ncbi:hypothetical protein TNCV_4494181 [Trichonephila clavipes]|nr:hypothetical protein TNCV_4494181 [Trichonephila clavipes]
MTTQEKISLRTGLRKLNMAHEEWLSIPCPLFVAVYLLNTIEEMYASVAQLYPRQVRLVRDQRRMTARSASVHLPQHVG